MAATPHRSNNQFRRIGIIGKYGDPSIRDTLERLITFLAERGREIWIEHDTAHRIPGLGPAVLTLEELGDCCDLAIVVGGDGTLLRSAVPLADHDVALLGINLGRLGFLTDVPQCDMTEVLGPILEGEYEQENRFLLSCETADQKLRAFNDVVIHKWNIARMIEFETRVNDRFVNNQRSDGLIVSTPSGSSAYALSGGGPLVHPTLDALLLVPICPHALSNRPLMLGGDSEIEIRVSGHTQLEDVRVTCDGQAELMPDDGVIRIRKYPNMVRMVHPRDHDYFYVLRHKLGWSENPERGNRFGRC